MKLADIPLFHRLAGHKRILLAGCGGGFDIFAGLPLAFSLEAQGHEVHLANLTFSNPRATGTTSLSPKLTRVDAEAVVEPHTYFPEHYLSQWFAAQGRDVPVYCLDRTGVQPLRQAYQQLLEELSIDAVVLMDGGTDSLMRGDEASLATPSEDAISMMAVAVQPVASFLVCVGFGIDTYHGICHAHFLENVAALAQQGAFLGTFSYLDQQPEVQRYKEALAFTHAQMPWRPSIVNASIVSAIEGHYGDHHATERTRGTKLWINPLMSICWCFDLLPVYERMLYRDHIEDTTTFHEVVMRIESFRNHQASIKPRESIPV